MIVDWAQINRRYHSGGYSFYNISVALIKGVIVVPLRMMLGIGK